DLDGKLLYLNASGRKMIGLGPGDDIADVRLYDIYPFPTTDHRATDHADGNAAWSGEGVLIRSDGATVPVLSTAVLHRGAGRQEAYLSLVAHDITQRKEMERVKDELVANVSHELRTPLASLRGFSELLLQRDLDESRRRRYIEIMLQETIRLS